MLTITRTETVTIWGKTRTIKYADCERCGEEVMLDDFTNPCDGCGTDYDLSGRRLAPRRHWGEETGEHWVDVANFSFHDW